MAGTRARFVSCVLEQAERADRHEGVAMLRNLQPTMCECAPPSVGSDDRRRVMPRQSSARHVTPGVNARTVTGTPRHAAGRRARRALSLECGDLPISLGTVTTPRRAARGTVPTPPRARPEVSTSVDAFRRILRALRVAAGRTQSDAGISAAQLFVLRTLADGSECSLSEIAARTMTDRTSVASVVDRLVDACLVSRRPSRADRRRAAISLTRKGYTVLQRAPEAPTALLVAGLGTLSDRQLTSLATGLTTLTRAMGLSEEPAGMLFEDATAAPPSRAPAKRARS